TVCTSADDGHHQHLAAQLSLQIGEAETLATLCGNSSPQNLSSIKTLWQRRGVRVGDENVRTCADHLISENRSSADFKLVAVRYSARLLRSGRHLLNAEAVEKGSAPDSVCVTERVFRRSRNDVAGSQGEVGQQIRRTQD